jgi:hypothetical protein
MNWRGWRTFAGFAFVTFCGGAVSGQPATLQAHGMVPRFVRTTDYARPTAAILPVSPRHALPADWKTEGEPIDRDSLTGWLLTCWEGNWRGYWSDTKAP